MNDRVRTSISRLIDDMSTPQDDSEKDGAIWKPSATKLAEMEQKYACADPGSVKGVAINSVDKTLLPSC